jgi:hypothetical protein
VTEGRFADEKEGKEEQDFASLFLLFFLSLFEDENYGRRRKGQLHASRQRVFFLVVALLHAS